MLLRLIKPITESELGLCRFQSLAMWGACIGAVAAGIVAYLILNATKLRLGVNLAQDFPVIEAHVTGDAAIKRAEKIFYLLFYVFGAVLAFAALRLRRPFEGRSLVLFYVSMLTMVLSLETFLRDAFQQELHIVALTVAVLAIFVPFVKQIRPHGSIEGAPELRPITFFEFGRIDAALIAALLALTLPLSVQRLAGQAATNPHAVSFLVGPALYQFSDGMVPGRDFLSFYGYGPSHLFGMLLPPDPNVLYLRYVGFVAACIAIYHLSAYWVLRDFFQSKALPFVLTAVFLALCQFGEAEGFSGPSALAIRYMFVFIATGILAHLMVQPSGWSLAALSAVCAISIFWNTETGIYTWVVGCAVLSARILERRWPWEVAAFTGLSAVMLLALFGAAYGPAVLTMDFLRVLLAPIALHSVSNWVGVPIKWEPGFGTFYQLIFPAMAIGTAISVAATWAGSRSIERAYLLVLSIVALVFMAKWMNRSLDAVWQQNAFAFLAIGAWWCRAAFRAVLGRQTSQTIPAVSLTATAVLSFAVLFNARDRQQNVTIGLPSYLQYPSIASLKLGRGAGKVNLHLDPSDIDLINKAVPPHGRLLLLSDRDWLVLATAGRAPKSYFLPFRDTFSPEHVTRSFAGSDHFILERGATYEYDWLKTITEQILSSEFERTEESASFILYRRKT
ncbi:MULTISPECIES: hypothetical protein [Bradyrhizobium]|uniref:hypothetical protein n=1 Tax=Bradyrhizobium TaxID=374 RepID=UPI00155ECF5F|nr:MULTISPECIES: hypothetical protein [Bradyrhizobium]MDD1522098.1 hypothetical protein [Bradyrhizobium sp. WBAH30]MDD1544889.1 hypothetical protein [Bradyrhizobium sp. WBAH41]MDD1556902.1 hypothetical protein [Bradyrhizobium sp. WBAH23]MDD1589744.1 hypothetical protein [Bradyrhizobium sp. WBAH42]NRB88689.1 hypothetical protein [Bradyrhizobium sp. WBAH10]